MAMHGVREGRRRILDCRASRKRGGRRGSPETRRYLSTFGCSFAPEGGADEPFLRAFAGKGNLDVLFARITGSTRFLRFDSQELHHYALLDGNAEPWALPSLALPGQYQFSFWGLVSHVP
jgi:hypothetical protein